MFFNQPAPTYRKRKPGLLKRLFRSTISIFVLSAFIISIGFAVAELSKLRQAHIEKTYEKVAVKFDLPQKELPIVSGTSGKTAEEVILKIALISDSEDDFDSLEKALTLAKEEKVSDIIFLGDLTNWGDRETLLQGRDLLDATGINYYIIPGDHDLADSASAGDLTGLNNFLEVFEDTFYSFSIEGINFVLLNNAGNHSLISSADIGKFQSELPNADFIMLSQPLYSKNLARSMGVIDGEADEEVKAQADSVLESIRKSQVKAIIAADHHMSGKAVDPINSSLFHHTIGALTAEKNFQKQKFAILKVYKDKTYTLDDKEIF